MNDQTEKEPRVTLTVSCPLSVYTWLRQTQRNVSAFVVRAVEAERRRGEEVESEG
jgi:post-segregation antitoxin (ccd killing protein)